MARLRRTRRCFAVALIPAVAALVAGPVATARAGRARAAVGAGPRPARVQPRGAGGRAPRCTRAATSASGRPGSAPRCATARARSRGAAAAADPRPTHRPRPRSSADGARRQLGFVCPTTTRATRRSGPSSSSRCRARSARAPVRRVGLRRAARPVHVGPRRAGRTARCGTRRSRASTCSIRTTTSPRRACATRARRDARRRAAADRGLDDARRRAGRVRARGGGAQYTACSLATLHHGWFGSRREREIARAGSRSLPSSLSRSR